MQNTCQKKSKPSFFDEQLKASLFIIAVVKICRMWPIGKMNIFPHLQVKVSKKFELSQTLSPQKTFPE